MCNARMGPYVLLIIIIIFDMDAAMIRNLKQAPYLGIVITTYINFPEPGEWPRELNMLIRVI